MTTTTANTQKPASRLVAIYGTPAPIRTSFPTRWSNEKCCVEVACTCGRWYRKTHNANCPYCCIDLAYVATEQPAPATVATPEPVAVEASQEPTENACEAEPAVKTFMFLPGESRPFVYIATTIDRPEYGLKADQAFYLVRSDSLTKCAEQPVYWIVVWSYELCRWVCPCGDPHRQCKHTKQVNQDCRNRSQQQPTEQPVAA